MKFKILEESWQSILINHNLLENVFWVHFWVQIENAW